MEYQYLDPPVTRPSQLKDHAVLLYWLKIKEYRLGRDSRAGMIKFLLIGLVALIAVGFGGSKFYMHYKVSKGVDQAIIALSPHAAVSYGGISSTLTGELTVDDVYLQIEGFRDAIDIGRLGITTPSYLALLKLGELAGSAQQAGPELPEYIGVFAEDIRIPVGADYVKHIYEANLKQIAPADIRQRGVQCVGKYGHSPKALTELGYEELVISISTVLHQADNHYATEVGFGIDEMIDAEVEIKMAGNAMTAAALGPNYQPQLTALRIEVTDRSLNRRINEYCTRLGLTPEQIERAHLSSLKHFGATFGIEFDEYVIEPYKEFVGGKTTFIATAKPRRPLQLSRIEKYRPSDVPALLNLEAVAQ